MKKMTLLSAFVVFCLTWLRPWKKQMHNDAVEETIVLIEEETGIMEIEGEQ